MKDIKHIFIVNPVAGATNCVPEIQKFASELSCKGYDVCVFTTYGPGQAELLAGEFTNAALRTQQKTRIYACGGDGTLNGVLNGVMTSQGCDFVEITHVPRGSGNDFIKSFSRPKSFFELENFFSETKAKKIDVIQVNGRFCINICSIGLDARIAADATNNRSKSKKAAYNRSIAKNLSGGLARMQKITIQDIDYGKAFICEPITMSCICNGSWYGGGYNPIPDADIEDGILDVLVVKEVGLLKAISLINAYKHGKYKKYPDLILHYRTKELSIETEKYGPINIDGEICDGNQAVIKIIPKAISFFAPIEAW